MPQPHIIATIGELLVEFTAHQTGSAPEMVGTYSGPHPAGAPAIYVDQAARMGARTEMIGGVGQDGFGHAVLHRLGTHGVGLRGVTVSDAYGTGVAFRAGDKTGWHGDICHLTHTAADTFTVPADLLVPSHTMLHISATSLGNANMRAAILSSMHTVAAAGGKITCDPHLRPEWQRNTALRDALEEVFDYSYCVMPGARDLDVLFPDMTEDAALDRMLSRKAEVIALKRGAGGATIVSPAERFDIAGHPVAELDPTGAGPCFCGTFTAFLSQGASVQMAGRMANAAGAIATTRRGAMAGNSTLTELQTFMADHHGTGQAMAVSG